MSRGAPPVHTRAMRDDVEHLGVIIGDPTGGRIVALGTSAVFSDQSLFSRFWHSDGSQLDSGLQAHLYTRPDDIFIVRVPDRAHGPARRLATALDANRQIWGRLVGIDLASSSSRVILVHGPGTVYDAPAGDLPSSMTWFEGTMRDAVVATSREGRSAVLAFVLDDRLLAMLGMDATASPELVRRARMVSRLMDKNAAMSLLAGHGVPTARTYVFDSSADTRRLADLPLADRVRYVFKPAGGAAGIGVFTDGSRGAEMQVLADHVEGLRAQHSLPGRFQVQEFIAGPVMGATIMVDGDGGCRVFEIHHQIIDGSARFAGARWTRSEQTIHEDEVVRIGRRMSAALGEPLLLGLDLVEGRVIEVNPRLTASAPIAHLLRRTELEETLDDHEVERIDLDTHVPISYDAIASGRVDSAVDLIRARYATLVLPQGLNPFGDSRVAFVNDDRIRSARSAFMRLVS